MNSLPLSPPPSGDRPTALRDGLLGSLSRRPSEAAVWNFALLVSGDWRGGALLSSSSSSSSSSSDRHSQSVQLAALQAPSSPFEALQRRLPSLVLSFLPSFLWTVQGGFRAQSSFGCEAIILMSYASAGIHRTIVRFLIQMHAVSHIYAFLPYVP